MKSREKKRALRTPHWRCSRAPCAPWTSGACPTSTRTTTPSSTCRRRAPWPPRGWPCGPPCPWPCPSRGPGPWSCPCRGSVAHQQNDRFRSIQAQELNQLSHQDEEESFSIDGIIFGNDNHLGDFMDIFLFSIQYTNN